MKPLYKGLALGVIHLALVASLGAKMLYDRATRPRVWVRTGPVDPNLPIRGRYVALRLEVPTRGVTAPVGRFVWSRVSLRLENGQLVAVTAGPHALGNEAFDAQLRNVDGVPVADIWQPAVFFIPEHAVDPSRRRQGEDLWVEVTVPKKGPPRPIRLGAKKGGILIPLELR
jgi:hypothetical protein